MEKLQNDVVSGNQSSQVAEEDDNDNDDDDDDVEVDEWSPKVPNSSLSQPTKKSSYLIERSSSAPLEVAGIWGGDEPHRLKMTVNTISNMNMSTSTLQQCRLF